MSKYRDLDRGDVLPASWTDALQEFISTVASNVVIETATSSSIRISADTGSEQVALGIGGLWRYRTTDVTAAMPGGTPGDYDIYVSAQANSFSNSPTPDTDNTVYDFGLHIVTGGGSAPSGGGIVATRKIGELTYSGTAITEIRNLLSGGPWQPLDGTLRALAALNNTAGMLAQTGADTFARRTIAGTAGQITVTNGDGASGAPTISLPATITQATTFSGAVTTTSTLTPATIDGTPNFTGNATGQTQAVDNNSTRLATTAFVIGQSYAKLASPALTGTPTAPTAAVDTNTTQLATTAFVIGQGYAKLASPTFTGTPAAPNAAVDTNTTQLATTAFVIGQAASANPVINGTAAPGTSTRYARGDHVHPTDTSRAPLASPTFTGVPAAPTAAADTNTTQLATTAYVVGQGYAKLASPTLTGTPAAPTAAVDTNTTQLATTAFVIGQAASASPAMDGAAAAGTSTRYARGDHVHPTDTSRSPLASPTFTGTPAAPTAAVDTNTTQLATTAFVIGQAASATPIVDGTGAAGTSTRYARADHVHPTDTSRAPTASPTFTGTAQAATFKATGNVAFNTAITGNSPAAPPDYTISGGSTDRSVDFSATTIGELQNALYTLIGDLQAIGLLQ